MKRSATPPPLPHYPRYPVIKAQVWQHAIKRYNKNPLITAIRPLPDTPELPGLLTRLPEYNSSERNAPSGQRTALLKSLSNIFLGFPRVAYLMESIHALILYSYLDRMPFSPELMQRRQHIYEMGSLKEIFEHCNDEGDGEFTAALLGMPGVGKTKAVRNITLPLRCVIHHEALGIYQIPALLIEMPPRGASVFTLARNIIGALDAAFPSGNYAQLYLTRERNAESLLVDAMNLLDQHFVGILIVDEGQNKNYLKYNVSASNQKDEGQTPLASMLIALTNFWKIPLLLCATAELIDTLSPRLSMKRRLVGHGITSWGPLTLSKFNDQNEMVELGEFDVLLKKIWKFQWTKTPFKLDDAMRNEFFYQTQGITDFVIKLFHDVQLEAIRKVEGEIVSPDLVRRVANTSLAEVADVLHDLREKNFQALGRVSDVAAFLRLPKNRAFFDSFHAKHSYQKRAATAPAAQSEDLMSFPDASAASTPPMERRQSDLGEPATKPRPSKKHAQTAATPKAATPPVTSEVQSAGPLSKKFPKK